MAGSPELPVLPPANAIDLGSLPNAVGVFKLARACEVVVDPIGPASSNAAPATRCACACGSVPARRAARPVLRAGGR
ncbi:hypothetical protein GCM10018954_046550 [Kutzneria kofuensis]